MTIASEAAISSCWTVIALAVWSEIFRQKDFEFRVLDLTIRAVN